jgi:hypothetical protein
VKRGRTVRTRSRTVWVLLILALSLLLTSCALFFDFDDFDTTRIPTEAGIPAEATVIKASLSLKVNEPIALRRGEEVTLQIVLDRNGVVDEEIDVTLDELPVGVTVMPSTKVVRLQKASSIASFILTAAVDAPFASSNVTIRALGFREDVAGRRDESRVSVTVAGTVLDPSFGGDNTDGGGIVFGAPDEEAILTALDTTQHLLVGVRVGTDQGEGAAFRLYRDEDGNGAFRSLMDAGVNDVCDLLVHPSTGNIIVLNPSQLQVFTSTGSFVRTRRFDQSMQAAQMQLLNDGSIMISGVSASDGTTTLFERTLPSGLLPNDAGPTKMAPLDTSASYTMFALDDGLLLASTTKIDGGTTPFFVRLSADARVVQTFADAGVASSSSLDNFDILSILTTGTSSTTLPPTAPELLLYAVTGSSRPALVAFTREGTVQPTSFGTNGFVIRDKLSAIRSRASIAIDLANSRIYGGAISEPSPTGPRDHRPRVIAHALEGGQPVTSFGNESSSIGVFALNQPELETVTAIYVEKAGTGGTGKEKGKGVLLVGQGYVLDVRSNQVSSWYAARMIP